MRTRKLAFIDTETTGLLPEQHEIIEIGLVLVDQSLSKDKKLVLNIVDEWEAKIKPEHLENADPVALKICHYKEEDWVLALSLKEAIKIFAEKTVDSMMVGQNVPFDHSFLEKAFSKTGVENKMHYHKLDTISIAFTKLYSYEEVDKLSLRVLCEYLGVKNERAHSALSDARATFEVFKKLMEM